MTNALNSLAFWRTLSATVLAAVVLALLPGCGQLEEMAQQMPNANKKKEEDTRHRILVKKQKEQYAEVYFKAINAIPSYDRESEKLRIIKEELNFDFNTFFPEGMDPDALLEPKDVEALAKKKIRAMVERKFPEARRQEIQAQAAQEFPLFDIGDKLEITLQNNRRWSGKIEGISDTNLTIRTLKGPMSFPLGDIIVPPRACFDAEMNKAERQVYLNRNFELDRGDYIKRITPTVRRQTYLESAYIFHGGKLQRIDALIQEIVEPALNKAEDAYFNKKKEDAKKFAIQQVEQTIEPIAAADLAEVTTISDTPPAPATSSPAPVAVSVPAPSDEGPLLGERPKPVTDSEIPAPDAANNEIPAPDAANNESPAPDAANNEIPAPDATEAAPEVTEPAAETAAPEATEPAAETAAPEVTEPAAETAAPEATEPAAEPTEPVVEAPAPAAAN